MAKPKRGEEVIYALGGIILLVAFVAFGKLAYNLRWLLIVGIISCPILSFLIYKGKLKFIKQKDRKAMITVILSCCFFACMLIMISKDVFDTYLADKLVDGKIDSGIVWDESGEGEPFLTEKFSFVAVTKKGENMVEILSWGLSIISLGSLFGTYKIFAYSNREVK